MQIMGLNDETTISCNFEFFEKYLRNAMQMMNNRVYLLIDYENANRNLEKAKTGSKKQSVSSIFSMWFLFINDHVKSIYQFSFRISLISFKLF